MCVEMKVSRRTLLKMSSVGIATFVMMPRVAFAAKNSVLSVRTGAQPNGKTRLVIETSTRPSYDISYPQNQLVNRCLIPGRVGLVQSWRMEH